MRNTINSIISTKQSFSKKLNHKIIQINKHRPIIILLFQQICTIIFVNKCINLDILYFNYFVIIKIINNYKFN